jgi:hypothetical protein
MPESKEIERIGASSGESWGESGIVCVEDSTLHVGTLSHLTITALPGLGVNFQEIMEGWP